MYFFLFFYNFWLTLTDVRFSFVDVISSHAISGEQDDDDDEEETSNRDQTARIVVQINENIPNLLLGRFYYAILKGDSTLFLGTMVKFHNYEEVDKTKYKLIWK